MTGRVGIRAGLPERPRVSVCQEGVPQGRAGLTHVPRDAGAQQGCQQQPGPRAGPRPHHPLPPAQQQELTSAPERCPGSQHRPGLHSRAPVEAGAPPAGLRGPWAPGSVLGPGGQGRFGLCLSDPSGPGSGWAGTGSSSGVTSPFLPLSTRAPFPLGPRGGGGAARGLPPSQVGFPAPPHLCLCPVEV